MRNARPSLVGSRALRLTLFTGAYFCQGVPIGLLTIALPAWLAAQGVSVGEIAAYQGIAGLPWGLKLVSGPFMDRFAFPPMGRRRPWVMGAQAGLVLALISLMVIQDPLHQLPLVIALAFVVNAFAAVQDVAVDGMAIDVLPESERGRANAFMGFGQFAGFWSFAAICGLLLTHFGLAAAAAVCALTVGTVLAFITWVRERAGERLFPWSRGEAAPRAIPVASTFADIFKGLFKVLLLPMSVILTIAEWTVRMRDGVALAVLPVVATQTLGFSAAAYSSMQGAMGFAIAFVGIAIGPLIDRYGAKTFYMLGIAGSGIVTLVFALSEPLWSSTPWVFTLWCLGNFFNQMIFVSFIACAMSICWPAVAASQFAIYMSLSNLARSVGSGLFAPVANRMDVQEQFLLMLVLMVVAFVTVWFLRLDRHATSLKTLDEATSSAS